MSVLYKDKNGKIKKIGSNLIQRMNTRWFLCSRTMEDNQEYYNVPYNEVHDYFSAISSYTIYAFGFNEPNTTTTPKLRFNGEVYNINDITSPNNGQLGIGQLSGVYQMFTQETETDKSIYFVGNTHQDYNNLDDLIGRTIQLGVNGYIQDNKRIIFVVDSPETYLSYRTNGRKFTINAHLPIVVQNLQELDRTLPIAIEFGDTVYNMYNYMLGSDTPLTIGNIMSTARYNQDIGFFFDFEATFFQNSDIVGFGVIPPAIIALQLDRIIEDTDTVVTDVTTDGTRVSIHLAAEVVNKLARTLVTPMSAPPMAELVGIGTDKMQKMIDLSNGLNIENNTLKLTSDAPFISYTEAQTLTPEQQAQARANIGAGSGGGDFDGNYTNLTQKPILDTSSTITLSPVENETINGTIKLHKISKTGLAKDLEIDNQHNFVTTAEKQQITTNKDNIIILQENIATINTKFLPLTGGMVTGDTIFSQKLTAQDVSVGTFKAMVNNATTQQPFVLVTDNAGNTTKRAIADFAGDAGGTVVTVNGERVATFEMDNKADTTALQAEVTARTNALVNVNTQLSTLDEEIVQLNNALNTEAENIETRLDNIEASRIITNLGKMNGIVEGVDNVVSVTISQLADKSIKDGMYYISLTATNLDEELVNNVPIFFIKTHSGEKIEGLLLLPDLDGYTTYYSDDSTFSTESQIGNGKFKKDMWSIYTNEFGTIRNYSPDIKTIEFASSAGNNKGTITYNKDTQTFII